jgi:hypothetical protein
MKPKGDCETWKESRIEEGAMQENWSWPGTIPESE